MTSHFYSNKLAIFYSTKATLITLIAFILHYQTLTQLRHRIYLANLTSTKAKLRHFKRLHPNLIVLNPIYSTSHNLNLWQFTESMTLMTLYQIVDTCPIVLHDLS